MAGYTTYTYGSWKYIYGTDGFDWFSGAFGKHNVLHGYGGTDYLFGNNLRDYLYGGADNDYLSGGGGDDWLDGGTGDDRAYGGSGNDTFRGGAGSDYMNGGSGSDTVTYQYSSREVWVDLQNGGYWNDAHGDTYYSIENAYGSNYNDWLWGTNGANELRGYNGIDYIYGRDGNDTLRGGNDTDYIYGGDDNDTIHGDAGDDWLYGENNNDTIFGGSGEDHIYGGAHNDTLDGGSDDDDLFGEAGDDTLIGGTGDDTLNGGDNNDTLDGGAGNDTLEGGNHNDTFIGGDGADAHFGGQGTDTITYQAATSAVYVNLATGSGSWLGHAAGDTYDSIEVAYGSNYNDYLIASDDGNSLFGEGGNDTFWAGAGADTIDGGAGTDKVVIQGSANVTIDLLTGNNYGGDAHNDTYINIERVTAGSGSDKLYGNEQDNVLDGMDGWDWLYGDGGNNMLFGGNGNDLFFSGDGPSDLINGGDGSDTVFYASVEGRTLGYEAVHVDLAAGTAYGGLAWGDTLISIENISGSEYAGNTLLGDENANEILSWAANDVIEGRGGDDRIFTFENGASVDAGEGNDTVSVDDIGDNVIDGGTGYDTLVMSREFGLVDLADGLMMDEVGATDQIVNFEAVRGSGDGDILRGDAESNYLDGSAGDDIIAGRGGDDILIGGDGADVFEFVHHDFNEFDQILDFETGIDRIDLSDTEIGSWSDLNDASDGDYLEELGEGFNIYTSDNDVVWVGADSLAESDFIF